MNRQYAPGMAAIAAGITVMIGVVLSAAHGQEPAAVGGRAAQTRPVKTLVAQMTRTSGITVLADRSVADEMSAPILETVTPTTLETQLTAMTKKLSSGTFWVRLNLPAPTGGRSWNGDTVADYAIAQAKLFGNIGGPTPAGTLEVLGKKVSADQAQQVATTLTLVPVYVLLNPARHGDSGSTGSTNWATMSADEKKQYAQLQAQNLLNMDPASRQEYTQQIIQSMTPEQRQQFFQGMRGGGGGPGFGRRGRPGGNQ